MATYLEYLNTAMKHAQVERMENGEYFASIPNFEGLWASGKTEDEAMKELYSALDGWIDVHIKVSHERVPPIDGIDLYAPPKPIGDQ